MRFTAIADSIDPSGPDPFRDLIERDTLLKELTKLTPDERIVVVLRFWADLALQEIADRLGWPLGSIKSRLHRGMARLGQGLSADRREETEAPSQVVTKIPHEIPVTPPR